MTDVPTPLPAPVGPEPVADDEEGVAWLPSGRIRFRWEGKTFTMRRPRFGEYKEFRERVAKIDEDAPPAEGVGADPVGRAKVQQDGLEELMVWTFESFADKRLPGPDEGRDDVPLWLFSQKLPAQMVAHWQEVPLAPGIA